MGNVSETDRNPTPNIDMNLPADMNECPSISDTSLSDTYGDYERRFKLYTNGNISTSVDVDDEEENNDEGDYIMNKNITIITSIINSTDEKSTIKEPIKKNAGVGDKSNIISYVTINFEDRSSFQLINNNDFKNKIIIFLDCLLLIIDTDKSDLREQIEKIIKQLRSTPPPPPSPSIKSPTSPESTISEQRVTTPNESPSAKISGSCDAIRGTPNNEKTFTLTRLCSAYWKDRTTPANVSKCVRSSKPVEKTKEYTVDSEKLKIVEKGIGGMGDLGQIYIITPETTMKIVNINDSEYINISNLKLFEYKRWATKQTYQKKDLYIMLTDQASHEFKCLIESLLSREVYYISMNSMNDADLLKKLLAGKEARLHAKNLDNAVTIPEKTNFQNVKDLLCAISVPSLRPTVTKVPESKPKPQTVKQNEVIVIKSTKIRKRLEELAESKDWISRQTLHLAEMPKEIPTVDNPNLKC